MAARTYRRLLGLSLALVLLATSTEAQEKLLTIDDLYDPVKRINFSGNPAAGFQWIDGGHYAWPRRGQPRGSVDWVRVDAATGSVESLFDTARMEKTLVTLPGVSAAEARRLAHDPDLVFNTDFSLMVLTIADDLYLYASRSDRIVRLTHGDGAEEQPSFSPDGSTVAFVRAHNLFVVQASTARETALTTDGNARVFNGAFDWVYEEEIYGRGEKRAYWWSPDSARLAFLRIDDGPVSSHLTVDDIPYDPKVETWYYPRAGEPNPLARVGVVRVAGGSVKWVDTSKYERADHLIVRVAWSPDSHHMVYAVQDRTQTWLDLNRVQVESGATQTMVRETRKHWISAEGVATPTWLKDGSFLWLSARSGWTHLYHYKTDGTLLKQVTDGKWELRTLHGVDDTNGWIYFSGTERSQIGGDVYRTKLDGTGLQRLSKAAGTHEARFNPAFSYYIDSWSDISTPSQIRLHRSDGSEVRVLDDNKVSALADYKLASPELLQVQTRDGFVMEALMIKPPDFDPSRRYPVFQFTYAGPHSPQVRNAWIPQNMFHQLLAQKGIIVWICDNRTASGKGDESTWPLSGRFGDVELRDIEDGLSWLKQQPYVDSARIGLHGWSYGGFMTAYALTHSTSFVMGIAGGTVADWRDYDTVYTERYLGLPQDNPDGYRDSSPRWAAKNLHGALMLIHGAIDDNVHPQNTMQLAYELQKAGKPFRLMLYPKSRHAVTDPALIKHLHGMMLDFILEHLKPAEETKTALN